MQRFLLSALLVAAACSPASPVPQPTVDAIFPADYPNTFTQVRPCRRSIDHDLGYVTIFADGTAVSSYQKRDVPFPVGSTVLKVEYEDEACTVLRGYTAMKRESKGYDAKYGDWHWQKADVTRAVTVDGKHSDPAANPPTAVDRCASCHDSCGKAPDGFDGTCSAVDAQ